MPVFKKVGRGIVGFQNWHGTWYFTGVKDKFSVVSNSEAFDKSKNGRKMPCNIYKNISQILPTLIP